MAIDLRKLSEPEEVEQKLGEYLHIGVSTVVEVQAFSGDHKLTCSDLWEFSEDNVGQGFFRERKTETFDHFIRCRIKNVAWSRDHQNRSGRWPWEWLWEWILDKTITWDYFVNFSFRNQILVQIIVWKVGTGF